MKRYFAPCFSAVQYGISFKNLRMSAAFSGAFAIKSSSTFAMLCAVDLIMISSFVEK